ncbi:MAG: double-strand break repair helicase AddA [Pseudomonadota bacterium]
MTHSSLVQKQSQRDIDPNILQGKASNPEQSSWVSASAGSGKTKVLADRILRLLLPNSKGENGALPHKILALTYTKAAANEMALRIQNKLSNWITLDTLTLTAELKDLLERMPQERDIAAARRLFARVIDTPGGIPIMTIHSFCQSVLGRFPIESGISPQSKPMEDSEQLALIQKAKEKTFKQAKEEKGSALYEAITRLTSLHNEEQFDFLIIQLLSERRQIENILKKSLSAEGLYTNLCRFFGVNQNDTPEALYNNFCAQTEESIIYDAIRASENGSTKDQEKSVNLKNWLEEKTNLEFYEHYKSVFLTQKGTPQKTILTKNCFKDNLDLEAALIKEQERILALEEALKSLSCAKNTRDLFVFAEHLIEKYEVLKQQNANLDYDDLILKTLNLLEGRSLDMQTADIAPWIRFKLDEGIDHILVDEAQDTNPEQWEIIKALCYDFFDGDSAQDNNRSIFVVGDEKQSIFSFQRASPEKFNTIKNWFDEKIKSANKNFEPVDINISFRTVRSILECVDAVFEQVPLSKNKNQTVEHQAFRRGQPGFVELWPLFETEKSEPIDYWAPPIEIKETKSGASALADHIAKTIKGWLDHNEILESHNRPIEPGDIMVLVRTRNAFLDQLVRSLKTQNIPVSGVDRMVLNTQLVIEDLCAAAHFAILPDDDLTLACLLKSPLIGVSEKDLQDLALNRKNSLWHALKENSDKTTTKWLETLIQNANRSSPYDFFSMLLNQPCPADEKGGINALKSRLGPDITDPLDEFLNLALEYEHNHDCSLQSFLHFHERKSGDIKRELEEANDKVRIMTVHASKGLQAPIVILPDTIRQSARKSEKILWPNKTELELPLYSPRKEDAPSAYLDHQKSVQALLEQEYQRLLYVAMTRGENRLYVGGYAGKKKPHENSWYYTIQNAFEKLKGVEKLSDGSFRFANAKSADPDKEKDQAFEKEVSDYKEPKWLFKPMPNEPNPPKPLVPSRPSGEEPAALSPLKGDDQHRFRRGNLTHTLLQMLPDVAPDSWETKAKDYLERAASDLSEQLRQSIVKETLTVLNHPEFAPIFGKGSKAEVPITGLLSDKTLISGQIDRLLITDNDIYIIDFKTNRPPPTDPKDVPAIYYNQMKSYAQALALIYPERTIHTALLWTDGPHLMPLDIDIS